MLISSVLLHCAGTVLFFLRHCCIRAQNCDQHTSSTCNYCKTSLAVAKLRLDYSSITSRWEMRVNYWIGFSQLQMLMRWFGFCCRLYSLGRLKGGACSGWTWLFTSSQYTKSISDILSIMQVRINQQRLLLPNSVWGQTQSCMFSHLFYFIFWLFC